MQQPPHRPTAGETIRAMGPETLAAALSVVVVIAVVAFLGLGGGLGSAGTPTASPTASVASGGSAAPASPRPTAAPSGTRAPWTTAADTVLATDQRLLDIRADLRDSLAADTVRTSELVRLLRNANTLLLAAGDQTRAAADAGLPAAIVRDLEAVHDACLDVVSVAMDASIQNDAAFRDGAAEFIEAATPLRTYMTRLADASGLPPPAVPATPAPSPSG